MQNKLRDIFRSVTIDPITGLMKVNQTITKSHFLTYAPAAPAVASTNRFVTTTNMKLGAYNIANASPPDSLSRNVTITTTAAGTADTQGTVLVTGTDYNGEVITETITPVVGTTVAGAKAFASVTAAVGAGWVINPDTPANDTIVIGFGNVIGMPAKIKSGNVILVIWNQAIVTAPVVTYDHYAISLNTVSLYTAGDSTKKLIVGYIKYTGV